MPDQYEKVWRIIPFNDARGNFVNASRTGIDTYFNWFGEGISAKKLVKTILIPISRAGLLKSKVDKQDINYYLGIIEKRVENNVTGSKWIVRNYRALKKELSNDEANVTLTSALYKRQIEGKPIHCWRKIEIEEGSGIAKMYDTLRKVMTTEIFVVHMGDPIELVKNIMQWKNIHHMPVVNKDNKLIGVLTNVIIDNAEKLNVKNELLTVKDIIGAVKVMVDPETTLDDAKKIMMTHEVDCLPIVENEELIGIFTENDLKRIIEKKQHHDKS